ncbi:MAG TPA: hypothetical protein DDY78_10650 [Planctomycetales bacterium]|jgi:uncharacterized protein (DUF433 family)|nr:hypothetical protein [Planctomycetales bacterium]
MKTKTATPTPHIWLDETGRAWIDDTNIKVIEVVLDNLAPEHLTADQIYEAHGRYLSLAQIYAAFAYYYDHKAEFDAEIERQEREFVALRASSLINDPIRAKLRALRKIS